MKIHIDSVEKTHLYKEFDCNNIKYYHDNIDRLNQLKKWSLNLYNNQQNQVKAFFLKKIMFKQQIQRKNFLCTFFVLHTIKFIYH